MWDSHLRTGGIRPSGRHTSPGDPSTPGFLNLCAILQEPLPQPPGRVVPRPQGSCEEGWAGLSLSDTHSSHPSDEHSLPARVPGGSECFPCWFRGHTSQLHWRFLEPLRSRPHFLPQTPASWEGCAALRVLTTLPGTLPPRCCALLDRDVASTSISSSYFLSWTELSAPRFVCWGSNHQGVCIWEVAALGR